MSLNRVCLQGRLGADPEIRYLEPSGTPVCKVNIAVDVYGGKDETGKAKMRPVWITIKTYEKTAQLLADHWKKGDAILVDGRLDMDTWTDKESGQKRTMLYVRVDNLNFAGKREQREYDSPGDREAAERTQQRQAQGGQQGGDQTVTGSGSYSDDLPPDLDDSIPF